MHSKYTAYTDMQNFHKHTKTNTNIVCFYFGCVGEALMYDFVCVFVCV